VPPKVFRLLLGRGCSFADPVVATDVVFQAIVKFRRDILEALVGDVAQHVSMAEVAATKGNLYALQAAWHAGAEIYNKVLDAAKQHNHMHIVQWIEWNVPGHDVMKPMTFDDAESD